MTLNGDGSGKVTLSGTALITGAAESNELENVNNTISGAGTISNLTLVNDALGTIDATGVLTLDTTNTITNDGLIEATGGGELDVKDSEIDWTGGTATLGSNGIVVDGTSELLVNSSSLTLAGSGDVDLSGTITGQAAADALLNYNDISGSGLISSLTLTNEAGGTIDATGVLTLDTTNTITNDGLIEATGGGELDVKDSEIDWTGGTATLGSNGIVVDGTSELLVNSSSLTLAGSGDVDLSGTITGQAAADALLNYNDISGSGLISSLTLTNEAGGTIDATGVLTLDTTNTITNDGLIEATGGGELDVKDSEIDWTGGTATLGSNGIVVDGTSELLVNSSSLTLAGSGDVDLSGTITGQAAADALLNYNDISGSGLISSLTLTNEAGGTIDATGVLTLDTTNTITNDGLIEATGGGELDVKDSEIDWTGGTATLGSNGIVVDGTSELLVNSSSLTLAGSGDVGLSGTITGQAAADALLNYNDISGSGLISSLTLTNEAGGTIDATGVLTLDTTNTITNDGLIEATGGGGLDVKDSEIDWTGGTATLGSNGIVVDGTSELLVDSSSPPPVASMRPSLVMVLVVSRVRTPVASMVPPASLVA